MSWILIVILFIILNGYLIILVNTEISKYAIVRYDKIKYNKKTAASSKKQLEATKHGKHIGE